MRKVVYTAIFGDGFKLHSPLLPNDEWEHICFTDRTTYKSQKWNIIYIKTPDNLRDQRLMSRDVKLRYHNYISADISIYLDSKLYIATDLNKYTKQVLTTDFALWRHNKRKCAYEEAKTCIAQKKDEPFRIQNQIKYYTQQEFPHNFGLYACGILIRKDTNELRNFMDIWFKQLQQFSHRDQISFPFVLWKTPITFNTISWEQSYKIFATNKIK